MNNPLSLHDDMAFLALYLGSVLVLILTLLFAVKTKSIARKKGF